MTDPSEAVGLVERVTQGGVSVVLGVVVLVEAGVIVYQQRWIRALLTELAELREAAGELRAVLAAKGILGRGGRRSGGAS